MLSAEMRGELRDRAVAAWNEAKQLTDLSAVSQDTSCEIRGASILLRLEARQIRESAVRKVDHVVFGTSTTADLPAADLGIGLVGAHRVDRIGALHDAAHRRLGRVYAAGDGPTVVGLGIVHQPDLAVLDNDLAIMSGLETAVILRAYSPATTILLITSDPDIDHRARREGIVTQGPAASADHLSDVIDGLVAGPGPT